MNQKTYLDQLKTALELKGIADVEEIIEEYSQHFALKKADGYTEEEISARLDTPAAIAQQFEPSRGDQKVFKRGNTVAITIGMGFADLMLGMVYILLYAWVIVFGAFAVASLGTGVILALGIRFNALIIPYMPILGGIVLGISMMALGVLTMVGTIYLHLYLIQLAKAYGRWHKNTLSAQALPPLSLQPALNAKFKRRTRKAAMMSSMIFGITFIFALLILFSYTGFKPFWHEWNWFR